MNELNEVLRWRKTFSGHKDFTSCNPEEGLLYYSFVRNLRPDVVIEIGSYIGFSTICIALALKENKNGFVYAVDPGFDETNVFNKIGLLEDNIKKYRMKKWVKVVREKAEIFLTSKKIERLPKKHIMAVVDGWHHYELVKRDLNLLKFCDWVLVHDSTAVPDVRRAVNEFNEFPEKITIPTKRGISFLSRSQIGNQLEFHEENIFKVSMKKLKSFLKRNENKKIAFYGIRGYTKKIFEKLSLSQEKYIFIDKKNKSSFLGQKVYPVNSILKLDIDKIIISSYTSQEEMKNILVNKYGFKNYYLIY